MRMSYFVLGSNDRTAAVEFYQQLFADDSLNKVYDGERMTLWQGADFLFAVADPYDGQPATAGNGTMLGFEMEDAARVSHLHARAIALGGRDEGEPGERSGRFAAYVRDLDGNKLCFFA